MDELRWCSARQQARLVAEGEVRASDLAAAAVARWEELDPAIGATVGPFLDPLGTGVPMRLKDAGQEVAGTHHWCGVAALRGCSRPWATGSRRRGRRPWTTCGRRSPLLRRGERRRPGCLRDLGR